MLLRQAYLSAPQKMKDNSSIKQTLQQEKVLSLLESEREQLARRNAFHTSLSSLFREMEKSKEIVPLLQRIAQEIIILLSADSTYISMVHESKDYIEVVANAGEKPAPIGFRHLRGEGIAGNAWNQGEIQVVDDYYKYSSRLSDFEHIKQVCAIPIKVDGEVGVVIGIVYHNINEKFRERVVEFEEFAQQVTIVVENARLIEQAREEFTRKEALFSLSDALYKSNDIQTVMAIACGVVVDVCKAKCVDLYVVNDGQEPCVSATATVRDKEQEKTYTSAQKKFLILETRLDLYNQYLVSLCLEAHKPIFLSRLGSLPASNLALEEIRLGNSIGSSICIPLLHDEIAWGVLIAHRDTSKTNFTADDIALLVSIGNQVSVAQHQQKLQAKIEFQAYHDSLTGLFNRLQFEERLVELVSNAKTNQTSLAVLIVDLDGFKTVNDVFGHSVGDALLKKLSDKLTKMFHGHGLLARMGGDEFAVLLENVDTINQVMEVSTRAISILSQEYKVAGVNVKVGASIGISMYPEDSESAPDLLKNADIAMYQAKNMGKNCAQYFSDSMAKLYKLRVKTENDLANAIRNNQLHLVYQPKVSVSRQRVVGVEALVRWEHPTRGNIPPLEFIPIAEESGLIISIGEWVLREACRQLAQWHNMGYSELTMAVNVSVPQFSSGNFVETVEDAYCSVNLDAQFLNLEVTESFMLVDVERTVKKLVALKALGLSLSIDDFGTGFSSLSYLQDLPLDTLKIDRAFVQRLDDSHPQLSLVNTIIGMAETFGLDTVAEGVETKEQLEKIVSLGCDCIQGFLFSKPVAPSQLPETIASIEDNSFGVKKVA